MEYQIAKGTKLKLKGSKNKALLEVKKKKRKSTTTTSDSAEKKAAQAVLEDTVKHGEYYHVSTTYNHLVVLVI